MIGVKINNKCCREYPTMVSEIKKTARVNHGTIYLNQQERSILIAWMENNKTDISKCPHCGTLVKNWIENNYTIPVSAFPKKSKESKQ